ncbi:MAG: HU family DNA-binding protein [Desulfomicrobium sp.]|nr:HU family DNA-binding protein [Desulfomicrobium sp.]
MTKQKKNELKEGEEREEDRTYGTHGTNQINKPYENTEPTADHTSHETHRVHSSPQKAFYAVIREALAEGQRISLPGLGSFSVVLHAARAGRNPRTGEAIAIEARRRVHFKAGKGLRLLINP